MKVALLLLSVVLGVAACEPEATLSLLERSRAERQEWLDDLRSLDGPAARARYDADLMRLKELGVEPVKVGDRWTLGAEASRGARWAVDARGATRAELDAALKQLGVARGRYLVHLLSIEKEGWRMQLIDAVEPEIKFPELKERGRVWKSSERKALEAKIAALDAQIDTVRPKLGAQIRPTYVSSTRTLVERAQLNPARLAHVLEVLGTLSDATAIRFDLSSDGRLRLAVEPALKAPPVGAQVFVREGAKATNAQTFEFLGPKPQP